MKYQFKISNSETNILPVLEGELTAKFNPGQALFVNSPDEAAREILALQLANEIHGKSGKKVLWIRLEDGNPCPSQFGSASSVTLLPFTEENWAGELTRFLLAGRGFENDYSAVVFDSFCSAQVYSKISHSEKAEERLRKIANAILRIKKYLGSSGAYFIALGCVDPKLQVPAPFSALTASEFNFIKHQFQFSCEIYDLNQPLHKIKFKKKDSTTWTGLLSLRQFEPAGTPLAGAEQAFSIKL